MHGWFNLFLETVLIVCLSRSLIVGFMGFREVFGVWVFNFLHVGNIELKLPHYLVLRCMAFLSLSCQCLKN